MIHLRDESGLAGLADAEGHPCYAQLIQSVLAVKPPLRAPGAV